MTREEAKKLAPEMIKANYSLDYDNKIELYIDVDGEFIYKIFDDHEAQLKAKESDLERQDMIIKCLNIDLDNKEKLLKAKDERENNNEAFYKDYQGECNQ